jgi:hypothetical protein
MHPVTASGLASSIIAFLSLAVAVGQRAQQFAKAVGELPPDLRSCKDVIEVLARSSERLRDRLSGPTPFGDSTGYATDLEILFTQSKAITDSLISLFDEINGSSSSISKALRAVRKEGRVEKIRNDLQQQTLSILYVLEEASGVATADIQ